MKKFLMMFALLAVFGLVSQAAADWTVSTNWVGKNSGEISFVCSPCSNNLATNWTLSKGWIKGKTSPLLYWITSISNVGNTQTITNGVTLTTFAVPEVCHMNATNISVRVRKNTSKAVTYLKFVVQYMKPHSLVK